MHLTDLVMFCYSCEKLWQLFLAQLQKSLRWEKDFNEKQKLLFSLDMEEMKTVL